MAPVRVDAATLAELRRKTAFHEAGHAIVGAAVGAVVQFARLLTENVNAPADEDVWLGFVRFIPHEGSIADVPTWLAGYAAEHVFKFGEYPDIDAVSEASFGEGDAANEDYPRAVSVAASYLAGTPIAFSHDGDWLGGLGGMEHSARVRRSIWKQSRSLLERFYARTLAFVGGPARPAIEAIAWGLLAEGEIDGVRIHALADLVKGSPLPRSLPSRARVARMLAVTTERR